MVINTVRKCKRQLPVITRVCSDTRGISMKNEEMELVQELEKFLQTCSGHLLDICYSLYKILDSHKDYAALGLRFFLTRYEDIDTDKSRPVNPVFKVAQLESLEKTYGDVINKFIDDKAKIRMPIDKFYVLLWDEIQNGGKFTSEEERAYAIYLALRNPRIPYFDLEDGLQMSDEVYANIYRENIESVQKIRYILATRFNQKTQRASLLLNVLDTISNESKAVVFNSIIKYVMIFSSRITSNSADDEDID